MSEQPNQGGWGKVGGNSPNQNSSGFALAPGLQGQQMVPTNMQNAGQQQVSRQTPGQYNQKQMRPLPQQQQYGQPRGQGNNQPGQSVFIDYQKISDIPSKYPRK